SHGRTHRWPPSPRLEPLAPALRHRPAAESHSHPGSPTRVRPSSRESRNTPPPTSPTVPPCYLLYFDGVPVACLSLLRSGTRTMTPGTQTASTRARRKGYVA